MKLLVLVGQPTNISIFLTFAMFEPLIKLLIEPLIAIHPTRRIPTMKRK
jgi:hypothetical protein